ncbi:GntR family transcriptional regulator [Sanguibacter massiliensis]|uniref:GntR family transcriptional regulator n=1 Tax=Sanguibacter massiliensis TaxID=1973217 RepID=UPI002413D0B9|nr:GntR family transcriptional regulator [Sanguibacter massiliensis]
MTPQQAARRHKHLVVRDYLTDLIATELEVGDAVPSERALTERFDVSRMTVRQALDALVTEGTLVREQGRGTFVAPHHADFEMRLTTFSEEARRRGLKPGAEVLEATTGPASPRVARALDLDVDAPVHHVARLRTADGTPMSIESSWIPAPARRRRQRQMCKRARPPTSSPTASPTASTPSSARSTSPPRGARTRSRRTTRPPTKPGSSA